MDIINFIINMLYNLDIFWDIDRQKMHRNNKLRKKIWGKREPAYMEFPYERSRI